MYFVQVCISDPPPQWAILGDHTTPINPKAKMLNRALFVLGFVGILPGWIPDE